MKKEKSNPNYHMGKQTGYELINGEYHIAPTYQERFSHLTMKQVAIQTLVNSVMDHASQDLQEIIKQQQKVWEDLAEDIGIDIKLKWVYNGSVLKLENPPKAENH
jgi:hypothetical protein